MVVWGHLQLYESEGLSITIQKGNRAGASRGWCMGTHVQSLEKLAIANKAQISSGNENIQ